MKEEGEKAWSLLNQLLHDDRIDVDLSSTEYLISAFIRIKRLWLLFVLECPIKRIVRAL